MERHLSSHWELMLVHLRLGFVLVVRDTLLNFTREHHSDWHFSLDILHQREHKVVSAERVRIHGFSLILV